MKTTISMMLAEVKLKEIVETGIEFNMSEEETIKRMMRKTGITEEEAEEAYAATK